MSEPNKPPDWNHDKQLSFSGLRELLKVVKGRLEATIDEKKAELARVTNARDSLKK